MIAAHVKVRSIREAADLGWSPDGRRRRAAAPPRVPPEVLLRSQLYLVERTDRMVRMPERADASTAPAYRGLPLTIGPETRLHGGLWRRQDKYYAVVLMGLAALAWWGPF